MKKTERLITLDVFRGITVALMIMVNQPGSWSYKYDQMRHAQWNGCTLTDMVFPFFLFIVGIACWFAFQKYGQTLSADLISKIIRRTALIFLLGLALNFCKQWISSGELNLSMLRITGVLQRIAFCYGIGAILCLALKPRGLLISSLGILIVYWIVLWMAGGSQPYSAEHTIVGKIDLLLLGENHLRQGYPVDSSGLFASIPGIVNVIWGYLMGMMIYKVNDRKKLILKMFLIGVPAVLVAQVWNLVFPINKTLWTSSYVLYTSGWALVVLALLIWIIDVHKKSKYFSPFMVFGVNPLFAYIFAELWTSVMSGLIKFHFEGSLVSLKSWIFGEIFAPLFGNMNGSLFYSIFIMFFYWSILWLMDQYRIYIKI
jgi:predicted acyltransferase